MQTDVKRPSGRLPQDMRPIRFERVIPVMQRVLFWCVSVLQR